MTTPHQSATIASCALSLSQHCIIDVIYDMLLVWKSFQWAKNSINGDNKNDTLIIAGNYGFIFASIVNYVTTTVWKKNMQNKVH